MTTVPVKAAARRRILFIILIELLVVERKEDLYRLNSAVSTLLRSLKLRMPFQLSNTELLVRAPSPNLSKTQKKGTGTGILYVVCLINYLTFLLTLLLAPGLVDNVVRRSPGTEPEFIREITEISEA